MMVTLEHNGWSIDGYIDDYGGALVCTHIVATHEDGEDGPELTPIMRETFSRMAVESIELNRIERDIDERWQER